MQLHDRIHMLSAAGVHIREQLRLFQLNEEESELLSCFQQAEINNPWFTPTFSSFALAAVAGMLDSAVLQEWTESCPVKISEQERGKTVALIAPGNIPFACAHDLIAIILSGHKALIKPSSSDTVLVGYFLKILKNLYPEIAQEVLVAEGRLKGFDAVIASGNNSTHSHFRQYFSAYPCILRGHKNSASILTGNETRAELEGIANDIFLYFGMGCRSVSKLFVPAGYDFSKLFDAFESWSHLLQHAKYMNNYDYQRALSFLNADSVSGNDFVILKKDRGYASPVSVLFYEEYNSPDEPVSRVRNDAGHLQCVVSVLPEQCFVKPGRAQLPDVTDYADGTDTLQFLLTI